MSDRESGTRRDGVPHPCAETTSNFAKIDIVRGRRLKTKIANFTTNNETRTHLTAAGHDNPPRWRTISRLRTSGRPTTLPGCCRLHGYSSVPPASNFRSQDELLDLRGVICVVSVRIVDGPLCFYSCFWNRAPLSLRAFVPGILFASPLRVASWCDASHRRHFLQKLELESVSPVSPPSFRSRLVLHVREVQRVVSSQRCKLKLFRGHR